MVFQAALADKMGEHIDLDEISLDNARHREPDMQQAMVDYLLRRRLNWRPDLVVPRSHRRTFRRTQSRPAFSRNLNLLHLSRSTTAARRCSGKEHCLCRRRLRNVAHDRRHDRVKASDEEHHRARGGNSTPK